MGEKDWALLYTDERYLSKSDLMTVMGTSLIDGYWNDILAYRAKHALPLGFSTIGNKRFYLTYTEAIQSKTEAFQVRIGRFLNLCGGMNDPKEEEAARRSLHFACLKPLAVLEGAAMSDLSIKAVLNGTYGESNPAHAPVLAYEKTLGFFAGKAPSAPNEAFLAEAYGRLLGVEELTRFYRRRDFDGSAARAKYIYNPDYAYAPWETIESLMGSFFAWLQDEKTPYFAKAVAALYYLDYLKPFDERNSSLAALLGKSVIASAAKTGLAFLIPLESVILKTDRCKTIALETQRTGDLTFFLLYAIEVLSAALDALTGELNAIRIATYAPEYKELSPAEKAESEKTVKSQQLTFFNAASAAPIAPAVPAASVAPSAPTQTPIAPVTAPKAAPASESVPAPKAAPSLAPLPETQKPLPAAEASPKPISQPTPPMSAPPEPSIAFEPAPLSDKEAKEYVQYLLETNPRLSKNQASFLAFHCALGRYYTIQNFKDYAKCAYETARTSMDKLAAEGYYEKLQVKNKFVYTPVRKGDKKQ